MQGLESTSCSRGFSNPDHDCPRCPRLVAFREANRIKYKDYFNGPVPAFGSLDAELLIVGLAPGLQGANATGRPFTGDYAGVTLYNSLLRHGLAKGIYDERPDDGLELVRCRITNAVRCVPPENRPLPAEIKECRNFLIKELAALTNLRAIMVLGTIAHQSVIAATGQKQKEFAFGHGNRHTLSTPWHTQPLTLLDSYHCSRYNINTRRLTEEMFDDVIRSAVASLNQPAGIFHVAS